MEKVTTSRIKALKKKSQKISMLTAYDYSFAKILDEAGVDIVLVGDSLGNVVLGYETTRDVKMADMVHHTKAVANGTKRAMVVADMPFGSMKNALANAQELVKAGGEAVKIEGIQEIQGIKEILEKGIPVMGHLGCLPQTAKEYKIQRALEIVEQAKLLEQAGVFAIVLELVAPEIAKEITKTVNVPTIGIYSGPHCDGQVLVSYDMLGLYANAPKHAKKYVDLTAEVKKAVQGFLGDN
ncbi:MAG: 3-methyl-2-oxobutanoate hydroxymethyltransferase [Candidatus Margulisbacteria bacterium]|nr:3-methyl-2-oxobutanoate hydroxymethyltransferase [Candidatus Margulisiibacteriota bacterium]